jgi:hypothetical protein
MENTDVVCGRFIPPAIKEDHLTALLKLIQELSRPAASDCAQMDMRLPAEVTLPVHNTVQIQ